MGSAFVRVAGSFPLTPVNIPGRSVARLIFRNAPQAGADPAVGAWDWSSVIDISITYGDFGSEGNIKDYSHGMFQSVYDYPYNAPQ